MVAIVQLFSLHKKSRRTTNESRIENNKKKKNIKINNECVKRMSCCIQEWEQIDEITKYNGKREEEWESKATTTKKHYKYTATNIDVNLTAQVEESYLIVSLFFSSCFRAISVLSLSWSVGIDR